MTEQVHDDTRDSISWMLGSGAYHRIDVYHPSGVLQHDADKLAIERGQYSFSSRRDRTTKKLTPLSHTLLICCNRDRTKMIANQHELLMNVVTLSKPTKGNTLYYFIYRLFSFYFNALSPLLLLLREDFFRSSSLLHPFSSARCDSS